jgi:hypothetical protein
MVTRVPPPLAHDRPLRGTAGRCGGGEAGAQGVAGVAGRVQASAASGALDDAGDAAIGEAIGGELVVAVDAAEQSPGGDSVEGAELGAAQAADVGGVAGRAVSSRRSTRVIWGRSGRHC